MTMDTIYNQSCTNGDVGERLMAANFDPGVLRPFRGNDGRSYITANGKTMTTNAPATLRYDDWKDIDSSIVKAARPRMAIVKHLRDAGLTYSVRGGMGKTVLQTETQSRAGSATISMDGIRMGDNDRPLFNTGLLPLPIIHEDFQISLRQIEASRNGTPLDLTMAEESARNVAEEAEKLTIGLKSPSYGGGTVYGMINSPNRLTDTVRNPSTFVGWTPKMLVQDVLSMRQTSTDKNHNGPWHLYNGPAWDLYLDEDYSDAKGDSTLRERVAKIKGIEGFETLDYLTGFDLVLLQKTSNVIRLVIGMEMTVLQWDSHGGLMKNFKVMTIVVPQIRSDYDSQTGIVHAAAIDE